MVTVLNYTVGSSGRNYPTLTLYESATTKNLVTADEQINGLCYDDSDFGDLPVVFAGSTVDATRFRTIGPAAAQRYEPIGNTGLFWLRNNAGGIILEMAENYAQFSGFGIRNPSTTGTVKRIVRLTSPSVGMQLRDTALNGDGGGGLNVGLEIQAVGSSAAWCLVANVIARGSSATTGLKFGFRTASNYTRILNCVAHQIVGVGGTSPSGTGFQFTAAGVAENCVATSSSLVDYAGDKTNLRYSTSSDSSATGTGSQTGKSATACFTDASNNNFTPKASTSPLLDAGISQASYFTTDFAGNAHGSNGTWEQGCYDGGGPTTVTLLPGSVGAHGALPQPDVGLVILLAPSTVAGHGAIPQPNVGAAISLAPGPAEGIGQLGQPDLSLSVAIAPGPAEAAGELPQPGIHQGIPAGPLDALGELPAPPVLIGLLPAPGPVDGLGALPAPELELIQAAGTVDGLGELLQPVLDVAIEVGPGTVDGLGEIPLATVGEVESEPADGLGQVPTPWIGRPLPEWKIRGQRSALIQARHAVRVAVAIRSAGTIRTTLGD